MGAEDGEVYILRPDEGIDTDDEEAWMTPQPASDVIIEEIGEEVGGDSSSVESLDEYVDLDDLAAVFDGDEEAITFEVEGHDVTVTEAGEITVDDD
ncbi:HalOD1 output domain-containing protein [Halorientalis brevis]|uniref:HalOD1 output domain-containing protein n=1 Tax=Halorientalis brevis TaxID=1126241 RepID=A0ABD6CH73_9EURY|nr:HalOD1 output domain-containing protein [Halorientalis brevis]